jgi:hypothetical protein
MAFAEHSVKAVFIFLLKIQHGCAIVYTDTLLCTQTTRIGKMSYLEKSASHIEKIKTQLRTLSDAIWSNPELAYKEFFASSEAVKFLNEQNFSPKSNYCGLKTSFMAEFGKGKPAFAIFA